MVEEQDNIVSRFNDEDGKRVWHQSHFALTPATQSGMGVTVWLGSNQLIDKLGDLKEFKVHLTKKFYSVKKGKSLIFPKFQIARENGGDLTHIPPIPLTWEQHVEANNRNGSLKNFTDFYDIVTQNTFWGSIGPDCGNYWIGLAQYPRPQNWYEPDSVWPGWTHIFHSNDPQKAQIAFDFVRNYTVEEGRYPQNLKRLSAQLASVLGVDLKGGNGLYWALPWSCPLLDRHPLTGEVMDDSTNYQRRSRLTVIIQDLLREKVQIHMRQ